MSRIKIFAIFLLGFLHIPAKGESKPFPTNSLARFVRNIETYNRMFPREQVYLHFDNTGYFMGEDIWFKAYVVSPQGFKPTDLSRVLYVELLTPQGRVLQTQKLKIEDGQCHGCFPLAELLHAGFYEIRAYTALMLNWEDAPIFSRVFPVFNAPKEEGIYDNPRMVKLSHSERLPEMRQEEPKDRILMHVDFFPEGGNLVEGISSVINFKATDKRGNPLKVKGRICNNQGETTGELQTMHNGMGRFTLQPNAGETYHAEVTVEEGSKPQRFDLPKALKQGYVMSVNNLRDENVVIQLGRNELTDTTQAVGLTILCRGEIVMFSPIEWQGRNTVLQNIPKGQLPEGVNQLTLFDTEGRVHAERLIFIPPAPGTKISLIEEKRELKPKEKVTLDFKVTNGKEEPVCTNFSLSVRDADTELPTNGVYGGESMAANLLLGSELKGYIHHVDYYLEADDRTHRLHTDLLLCTQGWRKYNWTEMTRPEDFNVRYPVEEGIMVHGDLTSTFRNRKKEGVEIKVFLFNETGDKRTGSAVTDSLGKFAFLAEDFTGRWQMNIMTYENNKLKEMNVNLQKVKTPQGRAYNDEETNLFAHSPNSLEELLALPDTMVEYDAEEKRRWENLLPTVKVEGQKEWQSEFNRKWNNIIYDMEDERMRMDETGEEYLEDFWEWLLRINPYFGYATIQMTKTDTGQTTYDLVPGYKSRPIKFLVSRVGTGQWLLNPGEEAGQEASINIDDLTINDVEAIAICDKPDTQMVFFESIQNNYFGNYTDDPMLDPLNRLNQNFVYVTLFVRNDYFRYKDKRGHRKTKIQGFSPKRSFYVPDYSYTDLPDEKDFRRTLYWNPNVKTNAEGKATVQFYNTPTCRRIRISTETMR